MAGLRASIAVCITAFLLGARALRPDHPPGPRTDAARKTGALFTHWIADSLTLWKSPVTDEHLWSAAAYYAVLARMPASLAYVPAALAALGASTILWSLRDGEAGNLMFDGASICASRPVSSARRVC